VRDEVAKRWGCTILFKENEEMPTNESKPMSKTAFVLSQSRRLSARDVAERAKKAGLTINEKYVYVVRSNARRKKGGRGRGRGRAAVAAPAASIGTPAEREFRRLAIQLGVKKAEELLSDTKKKVASLIAGK
jgi:hypothetical protein